MEYPQYCVSGSFVVKARFDANKQVRSAIRKMAETFDTNGVNK